MMNTESGSNEEKDNTILPLANSNDFINREGIILKAGMRVKGFVTYLRSYGRIGDKDITGTIIIKHGRLYVNSDADPEKNYSLSKFAHNWLTQEKVAWLDII